MKIEIGSRSDLDAEWIQQSQLMIYMHQLLANAEYKDW
jgi:hypothetical protein